MTPKSAVPHAMDLSIIIVNWHSVQYLEACLRSIYDNTSGSAPEVIVLDNASYDGSAALVKSKFPQALFIQSDRNYGFAKGNNIALQSASGNHILLLNPDTEVVGAAIPTMLSRLRALPDAGAIGCRLLNSDGTIQTTCIQAFPTILNQLLDFDLLKRVFPRSKLWGMNHLFSESSAPSQVDMICGACIMLKRAAFENVGLLTTAYFMYGEDLDLCHKLNRSGYRVYFTGDAAVIHHGGKSSNSLDPRLSDVWTRAAIYNFLARTRGKAYATAYRTTLAVAAAVRLLLLAAAIPFHYGGPSRSKWKKIIRWAMTPNCERTMRPMCP